MQQRFLLSYPLMILLLVILPLTTVEVDIVKNVAPAPSQITINPVQSAHDAPHSASPLLATLSSQFQKGVNFIARFKRSVTLGVRVLVLKDNTDVLLVRHTYTAGWYLPGGGVDPGEAFETAAIREVREECGVELTERPRLVSVHVNMMMNAKDHVAFYVAGSWTEGEAFLKPSAEIAEVAFFPLTNLPNNMSKGSAARLDEWMQSKMPALTW